MSADKTTNTMTYKCISAMDICGSEDYVVLKNASIDCRNWLIIHNNIVIFPESVTSLSCLVGRGNNSAAELRSGDCVEITQSTKLARLRVDRAFFIGGDYNYYHYTIDFASAFYMKNQLLPSTGSVLCICAGRHLWQRQLVDVYADPDQSLLQIRTPSIIDVGELYFSKRCFRLDGRTLISGWHDWIRSKASKLSNKGSARRVYLSREMARNRRILNHSELAQKLAEFGYAVIKTEDMPISDQIATFRDAEVVVSPHGAGLTNIIYSSRSATLVELMPSQSLAPNCFKNICAANGVKFSRIECPGKFSDEHFIVNCEEVKDRLSQLGLT